MRVNILFRPRPWFLFVALASGGMLGYALFVQHIDFIDPCPLCVLQRLTFMWIGAVALLAGIHNPGRVGRWVYGSAVTLGGLVGIGIAGRHLWLQSLPADQVPDCGMGLNYMLETMPGECADVHWTFLGLSMPGWTFLWYLAFAAGTIFVLMKANAARA